MFHRRRGVGAKKAFLERLGDVALFWGLPVMCLDLIGVPRQALRFVLLIEVPATMLGVLVFALLEQGVASYIQRHVRKGKPS